MCQEEDDRELLVVLICYKSGLIVFGPAGSRGERTSSLDPEEESLLLKIQILLLLGYHPLPLCYHRLLVLPLSLGGHFFLLYSSVLLFVADWQLSQYQQLVLFPGEGTRKKQLQL